MLLAAVAVSRSCGSHGTEVSQEQAIAIATKQAGFEPCTEQGCVVIRAIQRGIPTRLFWLVGLAEKLGENGRPVRFVSFLIDARTGEIRRA